MKQHALLVEDDPGDSLLAQKRLNGGWTFSEAASLQEALTALEQGIDPDVVITDLSLPDVPQGNGRQVVKEIRRVAPDGAAIVVNTGAELDPERVADWSRAGADGICGKDDRLSLVVLAAIGRRAHTMKRLNQEPARAEQIQTLADLIAQLNADEERRAEEAQAARQQHAANLIEEHARGTAAIEANTAAVNEMSAAFTKFTAELVRPGVVRAIRWARQVWTELGPEGQATIRTWAKRIGALLTTALTAVATSPLWWSAVVGALRGALEAVGQG